MCCDYIRIFLSNLIIVYVCDITALQYNFAGWHDRFSLSFLHVFLFLRRIRKKCRSPGIKIGEIRAEDRRLNVHATKVDVIKLQTTGGMILHTHFAIYVTFLLFCATFDFLFFYYNITSEYLECIVIFSDHRC